MMSWLDSDGIRVHVYDYDLWCLGFGIFTGSYTDIIRLMYSLDMSSLICTDLELIYRYT
jgi:hypothetical protein